MEPRTFHNPRLRAELWNVRGFSRIGFDAGRGSGIFGPVERTTTNPNPNPPQRAMSNTTNNAAAANLTDTFATFKVGDPVNWSAGSDIEAGTVVRVTKTQVIVRRVEATLLNASDSGEADALTFTPGGFVGHTSGAQRWAFGEMTGGEIVFSRRVKTIRGEQEAIAKMRGIAMKGSMHSYGILRPGHRRHYDYNY